MFPFDALPDQMKTRLLNHLYGFITAGRRQRFEELILFRTRYMTVVLEDIYQSHNASAVLRTCDCFGIQDVHIIENNNEYQVNPDVALGASKWLTIRKYNESKHNTAACIDNLKQNGYSIYCTTPHENDFTPETLPLDRKFALVFGTELEGLSPVAMEKADGFVRIPMVGFTESLNISVSAAVFMNRLSERIRGSGNGWQLSEVERTDILLSWVAASIKKSDLIMNDFLRSNP